MKRKFLLSVTALIMSICYIQAQKITNVRQEGETLVFDYNLPKKIGSAKFYYKYQSQNKSNLIGKIGKTAAGNGTYIWDLDKTNTVLTGENLSFSMDTKNRPSVLIMAQGGVVCGLQVGCLFNDKNGIYITPGVSADVYKFSMTVGYIGKYNWIGWYGGVGYLDHCDEYEYDYYDAYNSSWGYYTEQQHIQEFMMEFGLKFFIKKIALSAGVSFEQYNGPMPQGGIGVLF